MVHLFLVCRVAAGFGLVRKAPAMSEGFRLGIGFAGA